MEIVAEKYYKITNEKELHNGYQYTDGLNILKEPFAETGSCVAGGFYFTTAANLHKFEHYGCNIREILLPKDNPAFKIVKDGDKFRSNMVILGEKYSILDPDTYAVLCLDVSKFNILNKIFF